MDDETKHSFEFGSFRFDCRERMLRHNGESVPLTPKASELLLILLENRGRLVAKQSLMEKLWPDSFVEDGNLSFNIHLVRTALGNGVSGKQYIENVPRRGYRFVAEVRLVEDDAEEITTQPAQREFPPIQGSEADSGQSQTSKDLSERAGAPTTPTRWRTRYAIAPALVIVAAGMFFAYTWASEPKALRVASSAQLTSDGRLKEAPLMTDGMRIYFYEPTHDGHVLQSVSIEGGEISAVEGAVAEFEIRNISSSGEWFAGVKRATIVNEEGELWIVPNSSGSPKRVGEISGRDPSWSPDGQWIAYVHENGVFVVKPDGTESRRIARAQGDPAYLQWSPDGKKIRFGVSDLHAQKTTLWEVYSDGSNLHVILPGWEKYRPDELGGWTASGDYFVFSTYQDRRYDLWTLPERGGFLQGGPLEPFRLAPSQIEFEAVTPSKADDELFALTVSNKNEVVRYETKLGQFVPFLDGLSAYWVEFSRNDKWIAYTTYPEEILWRSRPDGSEKLQLSFSPTHVIGLSWSPDGKRIAFRGQKPNRPWRLYIANAEGGETEELQTGNGDVGIPTWSADGTRIVFGDMPPVWNHPKGNEELHIYDFKTRQISAVPGSKGLWSSRWSPDGRYIAALSAAGQKLMLFDCAKKQWQSFDFQNVNEMAWSHDGQSIFIETGGENPTLNKIRIKTKKMEKIIGLNGMPTQGVVTGFTLAPDDSPIVLRELGTAEIYALKLDKQ